MIEENFLGKQSETVIGYAILFKRELHLIYKKAEILKEIRMITNECLSNGAYSTKNMEEQFAKLDRLDVPQWEKDIIGNAIDFKKKLAHKTLNNLNDLINKYKDIV